MKNQILVFQRKKNHRTRMIDRMQGLTINTIIYK